MHVFQGITSLSLFTYSHFLWSISHPGKCRTSQYDLSSDNEAMVSLAENLTPTQLAYERVISKVFHHYAIPLEISESIRATFKSNSWRMGRLFSKLGGTKRKQQLLK